MFKTSMFLKSAVLDQEIISVGGKWGENEGFCGNNRCEEVENFAWVGGVC